MNYEGAQFKASPAAIRAVTMGLTVSQTVNGKSTLGSRGYFFRIDNDRSREKTSWSQGTVSQMVRRFLIQWKTIGFAATSLVLVRSSQRKYGL